MKNNTKAESAPAKVGSRSLKQYAKNADGAALLASDLTEGTEHEKSSARAALAQSGGHTPLPWHTAPSEHYADRVAWIEPDICEMVSSRPPCDVTANADFIVLACNSHDALLAERDRLRKVNAVMVEALKKCEYTLSHCPGFFHLTATDAARAALALAEGSK